MTEWLRPEDWHEPSQARIQKGTGIPCRHERTDNATNQKRSQAAQTAITRNGQTKRGNGMNEVAERQETAVAAITPMHMLEMAVKQGADIDKMEKLMELERRWKDEKAREAYNAALTEFKKTPVRVTRDKENKQYNSWYSSLANLVNTVNVELAKFGLSARWDVSQSDTISVTCILSHQLGHSESVTIGGPPDESGKKNRLQQIKSTITYLKGATFEAVTGVVTTEHSDDGNGAWEVVSDAQVANIEALITEVGADRAAFLKYCKVDAVENIPAEHYGRVIAALQAKRSA
jgi:hypothetical protein